MTAWADKAQDGILRAASKLFTTRSREPRPHKPDCRVVKLIQSMCPLGFVPEPGRLKHKPVQPAAVWQLHLFEYRNNRPGSQHRKRRLEPLYLRPGQGPRIGQQDLLGDSDVYVGYGLSAGHLATGHLGVISSPG